MVRPVNGFYSFKCTPLYVPLDCVLPTRRIQAQISHVRTLFSARLYQLGDLANSDRSSCCTRQHGSRQMYVGRPSSLSVNRPSACLSSNRSMQIGAAVYIKAIIFWPVELEDLSEDIAKTRQHPPFLANCGGFFDFRPVFLSK